MEKLPGVVDPKSPYTATVYEFGGIPRLSGARAQVDDPGRLVRSQGTIEPGALTGL